MNDTYKPDLDPTHLETSRAEFASWVTTVAAQCANNDDLLNSLTSRLPAGFLAFAGEGTTRRVYATPLGVVVKIQRQNIVDDPIDAIELEERGGREYLQVLPYRRRMANLSELLFAAMRPRLMPTQYGFLSSLGFLEPHPSVLISETARPLDRYFLNDGLAVQSTDIGIAQDGKLCIFDPRMTKMKRPAHLAPYEKMSGPNETEVWLGNLGVTVAGEFVFVDRSDHGEVIVQSLINPFTLAPKTWGLTFKGSPEKNLEFSAFVLAQYQASRAEEQKERRTHG